jgi:hypothetical protein
MIIVVYGENPGLIPKTIQVKFLGNRINKAENCKVRTPWQNISLLRSTA